MAKSDEKNVVLHMQFIVTDKGTLSPVDKYLKKYRDYKAKLQPGQIVDCFLDANEDNGTLIQLAKIHACIKEISSFTGETVEKTKLDIKKMSGLVIKTTMDGENYLIIKSFAKCSKTELSLCITTIIEIGQTIGIDFTELKENR